MENKLQELTNKLYNEGVEKAKDEAQQIVDQAKKDAEKIKQDAKQEATQMVEDARKESEDLKKNVLSEIDLAAKQTLREIKKQITEMITARVISKPVKQSMEDADFMKEIIRNVIQNWNPQSQEPVELSVILPKKMQQELKDYFESKAYQELNASITVHVSERMKGGFSIGPSDGSYKISFSEADFENFFKGYFRPRTVKMLFAENNKEDS